MHIDQTLVLYFFKKYLYMQNYTVEKKICMTNLENYPVDRCRYSSEYHI